jgi:hypothetical protein
VRVFSNLSASSDPGESLEAGDLVVGLVRRVAARRIIGRFALIRVGLGDRHLAALAESTAGATAAPAGVNALDRLAEARDARVVAVD